MDHFLRSLIFDNDLVTFEPDSHFSIGTSLLANVETFQCCRGCVDELGEQLGTLLAAIASRCGEIKQLEILERGRTDDCSEEPLRMLGRRG